MFISKSFKELFSLTAFFQKADAKVRLIFELPKLFWSFFEKSFKWKLKPHLRFSISTHLRFSLESGCKITALQHIYQILFALFYKLFETFPLSRWFSKHAEEHKNQRFINGRRNYTLLLYIIGKNKTRKFSSGTSNLLYIRLISMKFPVEVPFLDNRRYHKASSGRPKAWRITITNRKDVHNGTS